MERDLSQVESDIAAQQARRREAHETLIESSDLLLGLELERRQLLGETAVRPTLRVINGGGEGGEPPPAIA